MTYPNPEQAAVLRHLHGTLLVLAPAGTGKTRLMADRLAAVVRSGLSPGLTLGVTFTNRAAAQMREAVAESCGPLAKDCRIQTFHSLCASILREEAEVLGLPANFAIYDADDSRDLMQECLSGHATSPSSIYHTLASLKSNCGVDELTLAPIPALDLDGEGTTFRKTAEAYHRQLAARRALDFADLLYRTRSLLELVPALRAKWTRRCRWIQLDELQDNHLSEYEIIRLLSAEAAGIAFFGDPDQSIYRWRGSCFEKIIARMREDFAPVTELSLLENHRSTKALIDFADRHAATFATRHTRIVPAPSLPQGEPPEVQAFYSWDEEASFVDIGAVKLTLGKPAARFQALLRPSRPLGDSAAIHGISQQTLETEGRPPAEVFREFARFIDGATLVGHNVAFDLSMMRGSGKTRSISPAEPLALHFPAPGYSLPMKTSGSEMDSLVQEARFFLSDRVRNTFPPKQRRRYRDPHIPEYQKCESDYSDPSFCHPIHTQPSNSP